MPQIMLTCKHQRKMPRLPKNDLQEMLLAYCMDNKEPDIDTVFNNFRFTYTDVNGGRQYTCSFDGIIGDVDTDCLMRFGSNEVMQWLYKLLTEIVPVINKIVKQL